MITDLPDHLAIKQLAASLYQGEAGRGRAAVLVGAGFSRAAAKVADGVPRPPLWDDLAKSMQDALGSMASYEPLQLAEEYQAYYGRYALKNLVQRNLHDAAYQPGKLHEALLTLPWAEVLTTNWDTLLERAAAKVHSPVYSMVRRQTDLAATVPPRIAKLHGTINLTKQFVFTQEDYRTYPVQQAAFVNFARQVFIENELCLLGFSANDPNFLAWVGWIRDNLNQHAKRIYLVGNLSLSAAKRKYFESINIAPVDLHAPVKELDDEAQHQQVLTLFLQALKQLAPSKPWRWRPKQSKHNLPTDTEASKAERAQHQAAELKANLPMLQQDRRKCPAWLVCPQMVRRALANQVDVVKLNAQSLAVMDEPDRHQLLYEVAWRSLQSFELLNKALLAACLAAAQATESLLSHQQKAEMALAVIQSEDFYQSNAQYRQQAVAILQAAVTSWPEATHWLHYVNGWRALERLDYAELTKHANALDSSTPLWNMRRALLLTELGEHTQAEALIGQAYQTLTQQHRDAPHAFGVFSQLAWAHWVYRAVAYKPGDELMDYSARYEEKKCSPWIHLQHLHQEVQKEHNEAEADTHIKPSFPAGYYQPANRTVRFKSGPTPFMLGRALMQQTGLPLRFRSTRFLTDSMGQALKLEEAERDAMWLSWVVRIAAYEGDDLIKAIFTPTQIATIALERIEHWVRICQQAMAYWQQKITTAKKNDAFYQHQRLNVIIEVLGRLSIRLAPDEAKKLFMLGAQLYEQVGKRSWTPIQRLLTSSLAAIPKTEQHEVLLVALNLPLDDDDRAPNVAIKWPSQRPRDLALDQRIDELISAVSPHSTKSETALLRLLPLARQDFLTAAEQQKLQTAVWGEPPNYQDPPQTGIYSWALAVYACAEPDKAKLELTNHFSRKLLTTYDNLTFLSDAVNFALQCPWTPKSRQALELFKVLIAWRMPQKDIVRTFSFGTHEEQAKLIGQLLAYSLVPALPQNTLTEKRFDALQAFIEANQSYWAISGVVAFAQQSVLLADKAQRFMRLQLFKTNGQVVNLAADAIRRWRQQAPQSAAAKRLVQQVINAIVAGKKEGLQGMLHVIKELVEDGTLNAGANAAALSSLIDTLPLIYASCDYAKLDHQSLQAVDAPLVRAECVKLARVLLKYLEMGPQAELLGDMLEQARNDPLPEVRLA